MLTNVNYVNSREHGSSHEGVIPRRERVRAATEAEILDVARQLLVHGGASSVTLREVGRRMGMTASALYRYVDGHAALLDALIASFFDELSDVVASSGTEAPAGLSRTERTVHDLMDASHAFRRWSLTHVREFGVMFGPRDPAWTQPDCVLEAEAGERFGRVFAGTFARGVDVSKVDGGSLFGSLPHPLDELFARSWLRLLGAVTVEVFGHHEYMAVDSDHLFELEMSDCGAMIAHELELMAGPPPSRTGAGGH